MAEKRNGTPKWLVKILVLLIVSFVTWWATQTWSRQDKIEQLNTAQDVVAGKAGYRLLDLEGKVTRLEGAVTELMDSVGSMNVTVNRMEVKLDFLVEGYSGD